MGWGQSNIQSFAARVRAAAVTLGANGAGFTTEALSHECGIQDRDGQRRLSWAVRDLKRVGALEAVSNGVYRLGQSAVHKPAPQKQEVMWRTLRGRRTVSVDDLVEFAGTSRNYAMQWLRMLLKRGVVRDLGNKKYQLIQDRVENPKDTEKAEKLRELRRLRKNRLESAIDQAQIRIVEAGQLLDDARDALKALSALDAGEVPA